MLGVAGLLGAVRAGNVALANAIGTGVADDKVVYHYVPAIIRYYLGEEPILGNVPTYLPSDPGAARAHPATTSTAGRQGGQRERRLRDADRAARRASGRSRSSGARVVADPRDYIAQPVDRRSRAPRRSCPTPRATAGRLEGRHVDLRPYILSGAATASRAAGRPDPRRAAARLAGRQLEPGRRQQGHLGAAVTVSGRRRTMLSRDGASRSTGSGRYVERAEQTARITDVDLHHTLAMGSTAPRREARRRRHWEALLDIVGERDARSPTAGTRGGRGDGARAPDLRRREPELDRLLHRAGARERAHDAPPDRHARCGRC